MDYQLEKRNLGKTGHQITFFGYGALEIGRDWGLGDELQRKRPADLEAGRVLNTVLDLGINIIDTARAYHKSEERIGAGISQRRQEFFLASKCGEHSNEPDTYYDFSYQAVRDSIELSLEKLRVDYIDLMQIHFGPNPEEVLQQGETVQAMLDAREAGQIRLLGASTQGEVARQCIEMGVFDVLQLSYSLLDRQDEGLIKMCQEKGIGVLIRGGLDSGRLTPAVIPFIDQVEDSQKIKELLDLVGNDTEKLTALALKFLQSNQGVSSVLVGSKNLEHIKKNIELLHYPIDDQLLQRAKEITEPNR